MTASQPLPSRPFRTTLLLPAGKPLESFPAPSGGEDAAEAPTPSAPLPAPSGEGRA
jgi:hypothetical protein